MCLPLYSKNWARSLQTAGADGYLPHCSSGAPSATGPVNDLALSRIACGVKWPYPSSLRNRTVVRICENATMFHGSGAVAGVPYFPATFMYGGMPGSVGSPNSELAIAYVQIGQSPPRPADTRPLRHSGALTSFLASLMPSCLSPLARFTQPDESLYGITMSALCAPALVSGPIRSVWLSS